MTKISYICLVIGLLHWNTLHLCFGQTDNVKLSALIKEANYHFLQQFVDNRAYLTPFEWLDQNWLQIVKNIEMVDSITCSRIIVNKPDTTQIIIKNNKTIIQNIGYLKKSYESIYLEDGRISKILDGKKTENLYVYDENSYLIQHGIYGDLKKAIRNGKKFEWYSMDRRSFGNQNQSKLL